MPIVAPVGSKTYSLFDSDLPLLAADAAVEIDLLSRGEADISTASLKCTFSLLERLKTISSNTEKFNVDRALFQQSLLPSAMDDATTIVEPSEVTTRLTMMAQNHKLDAQKIDGNYLTKVRDFFLEISSFTNANRYMLRAGSNAAPYSIL
jgi:hypothetical protein